MKRALMLLILLVMAACSHGRTADFPSSTVSSGTGQLVVMRNDNLFDWWFSVKVTYDEKVIASIRAGEQLAFQVPPGLHTVGVAGEEISVVVEANRTYYFLIGTEESPAGFGIERLDAARGRQWASKTNPMP